MSIWQKVKLGEVLSIKYGKDHKKVAVGDYPIYGSGGIMRYGNECLYSGESILIPRKGTLNNIFYINEPFWTVDTMFWTVPNLDIVYPKFLYYQLRLIDFAGLNVGSAVPSLTVKVLNDIEVNLPSVEEQRRIAGILGALDDKIEVNSRINRNLEQQAEALFRRWFVDFEFPNPDGKPYLTAGGTLTPSPLGDIPLGWSVGTLGDLGTIVGGGTPSKAKSEYYIEKGIAWVTPKDLSINKNKFISHGETDITELGYKNSSAKLMPKGAVLFSSRAPIGYIAIANNEVCTNQGFKSVVPNENIGTPYIYYLLKSYTELIESKATGSTFKEASGSLMKGLDVIIPSLEQLTQFDKICANFFAKQNNLETQNQTLAQMRDALLPKLMNNEI